MPFSALCSVEFGNTEQVYDFETKNPSTRSGKVYMTDRYNSSGRPILTEETALLVGTMDNGKITFNLPQTVDSRFLMKIDDTPNGLDVEPLGVEVWFYTDPFWLVDNNGNHIGDIEYEKTEGKEIHKISYFYFSEDTKINGFTPDGKGEYRIDAKKGWNGIYWPTNMDSESGLATTDLSKAPNGLAWLLWEWDSYTPSSSSGGVSSSSSGGTLSSSSGGVPSSSSEGATSIFANQDTPPFGHYSKRGEVSTYYDLRGKPLGATKPKKPGVYIVRDIKMGQVQKIIVR
jgi:hypothetical protein